MIGELALFSSGQRTASIRAITPMTLLEVTRDALERELPTGSWTRQILETVVQRFVSMDQVSWESMRGHKVEATAAQSDVAAVVQEDEEDEDEIEAPRPEVIAPETRRESASLYVAKIIGVTLALTGTGLLLLKLVASLWDRLSERWVSERRHATRRIMQ